MKFIPEDEHLHFAVGKEVDNGTDIFKSTEWEKQELHSQILKILEEGLTLKGK